MLRNLGFSIVNYFFTFSFLDRGLLFFQSFLVYFIAFSNRQFLDHYRTPVRLVSEAFLWLSEGQFIGWSARLGFRLLDALFLFGFQHGVLPLWINWRVENGHFANLLNLYKWAKVTCFQLWLAKGLSEIFAIFEKVYEATVHVEEDSDYCADFDTIVSEFTQTFMFCLQLFLAINIVIFSPSSIGKNVTGFQIHTPNIFLFAQVLIDQKVFSANTNTYFGIKCSHLINPILKVIFIFTYWNSISAIFLLFFETFRIRFDWHGGWGDYSSL